MHRFSSGPLILHRLGLEHSKSSSLIVQCLETHWEFEQSIGGDWKQFPLKIYDTNNFPTNCDVQN